jgi:hypothetical protein
MVSKSFLITHCPWPEKWGGVPQNETLFPSRTRKSLVAGKMKMKKKKIEEEVPPDGA